MANVREIEFGAFVVKVAFVGGNPAFALGDGTVRLIKRAGERVAEVHDDAVLTAVSNGKDMVTGGDDGRVAVIAADGGVRTVAERPRKWIDQVAIGPDGSIAFATGREAVVVGRDGAEKTFDHPRAVGGIAFAPKVFLLAVARYDGVTLWWAGTDAKPAMLDWKGAHIGISFSPDGKNLVTAMQENALHGWRLYDGRDMRMSGYPSKPRSLS